MQTSQTTQNNSEPLISIIVITYNSSEYLLETLESAKAQTYRNIELVISDDCSTDDTVALCKTWLRENKSRFTAAKLIESEVNTGTSANSNRGLSHSTGVWTKFIAGDDFLLPECISENIEFAKRTNAEFICSKMKTLENGKLNEPEHRRIQQIITTYSRKNQIKQMLRLNFIPTPSVFLKRDLLVQNGGFDETIPMIEDTPMWIKLLTRGTVFFFLDKYTVVYRKSPDSVSDIRKSINTRFYESEKIFFTSVLREKLLRHGMYLHYIHYVIALTYWGLVIKKGNDKNRLAFYEKAIKLLSPLWWKTKFLSISIFKCPKP